MARWIRGTWGPSLINLLLIDAGGPPCAFPSHPHRCRASTVWCPTLDDPHALDRLGRVLAQHGPGDRQLPVEQRASWAQVLRAAGVRGEV